MDLQSNRFKSGAKRLIDKHGKTRVYKSIGSETYNHETQTVETTSTLYTIKMFETEPKYKEVKSPNLVDKKLTVFLISATDLPVRPKVGDLVTDIFLGVDESVEVVEVSKYEGFGEACMWRVLCVSV